MGLNQHLLTLKHFFSSVKYHEMTILVEYLNACSQTAAQVLQSMSAMMLVARVFLDNTTDYSLSFNKA